MIERLRTDWLAWFLTLGALVSLVGPISLIREIGQPYGGYITFQRAYAPANEIDVNTPIWWSGIRNNRAQQGDLLIAVDGRPHATEARAAYAQAAAEGRPTAQLQVARDESQVLIDMPVVYFSWADFFDARMPNLITGFALWLSAIVVYVARPDLKSNRAFAIAAAVSAYGLVLYVHSLFFDSLSAVAVEVLMASLLAFIGPTLVNLAANFTWETRRPTMRTYVVIMFALGAVASVATLISRIGSLPLSVQTAAELTRYILSVILLLVGFATLFARLVYDFAQSTRSRRERRVAGILLLGMALAIPAIVASALNVLSFGKDLPRYFWLGLDLRYMLLFVPLAFAFVLVRYHALQSPSRLFIFLLALAGSAVIAALGAWFWTLVHPGWPDNGLRPPFLALFSVTLLTSLFWAFVATLPSMLGRNLDWNRYSTASARAFGRRVTANTDLSRIPETMAQALVAEFELEQAAVWLRQADEPALTLSAQSGERPTDLPAQLPVSGSFLIGRSYPFRPDEPPAFAADWYDILAEAPGLELMVPLVMDGELLGTLGLGRRWDEEVFDDRDLDIAELIGQQATLFLAAARHIQELRRVPGRMADVQERERLRLAQELHDTIQQFLGRLPFYLAVSRDSIETSPGKATDLLDRAIEDVEEAALAVRHIRHNLAPSQLERGLAQPLVTLTTNFQRRTGLATTLTFFPELDASTTLDMRHAIYRVIQQALDNVEAHAAATRVTVELSSYADQRIHFSVRDNGRGSSEDDRSTARAHGSFGIESMTARLDAAGGKLMVFSAPGHGFEVAGWVPVTVDVQAAAALARDGNGEVRPDEATQPLPQPAPHGSSTVSIGENP